MRSKRSWILRPKYCTTMLTTGSGRNAHSVSLGLMRQHEDQRAGGEHHGVGRVHDRRAEQHADGVQVVGGARHDVAGAGALVEAVGKRFQVAEQIVAQVELDVARDADQDPAGQELKDALGCRRPPTKAARRSAACACVTPWFRSSMARRMTSGNRIQMPLLHNTHSAPDPVRGAVLAQIRQQWAKVFEHEQSALALESAVSIQQSAISNYSLPQKCRTASNIDDAHDAPDSSRLPFEN